MRKIHVLGTPMQIVPPKSERKEGVDRFGRSGRDHFNSVDRDLFIGVDLSGWGRMTADFGYRIGVYRLSNHTDPTVQFRELLDHTLELAGIMDVHHNSHFIVSGAVVLRLREFFNDLAMRGTDISSTYVNRVYGVPVLELPIEIPIILVAPSERWMVIGH